MILHCNCANSTADAIHGKGKRPHTRLQPTVANFKLFGSLELYLCTFCYYVRTKALGLKTGKKIQPKKKEKKHNDPS